MKPRRIGVIGLGVLGLLVTATTLTGQPPFGGPGGGGPFGGQERKLLKEFDKDKNGWLNADERKEARASLPPGGGRGGRGPGGFGGPGGGGRMEFKPGPKVSEGDVKAFPNAPLYEPTALRTFFLEFENKDWETELEAFHNTDVDVPVTVTVDGKKYPNVGVHFRGMSSYGGVPTGGKRSLNLSFDLADSKQRVYGSKTLNLLNAHEDASFMSTVLYSHIARQYIPAPKANLVKVVINGESWGVYASVQQFDKEFLKENYKTEKGTRWKVRGSPGGGGGLEYLGDRVEDYKRRYEIKTKDDPKAWAALVNFCKVLNTTPADRLEAELSKIADVDGLLWFLALDNALINCDGYWIRASDYSIYLDDKNKFHFVPHDMNEAFRPAGGPGFGGGPGGGFAMRLPKPGDVMPEPIRDMLNMTGEQKKELAELQKEVDAKLDKLLTKEQKDQIKAMGERGPMGGGFPGGGAGAPPGGAGEPGGRGGRGGPGGAGGPGGGGGNVELDPLQGLTDTRKPLRSKVLAVPALKAKYLANVKTIAEKSLDWKQLGPVVAQYRALVEKEIEADTRKLSTTEAFQRATANEVTGPTRGREIPLRAFADQRRAYLIGFKEPTR